MTFKKHVRLFPETRTCFLKKTYMFSGKSFVPLRADTNKKENGLYRSYIAEWTSHGTSPG